jgi:hypothetical protein
MPGSPAHGWSFAGGDYSVSVGSDQGVFIETAKADYNVLFQVVVGRGSGTPIAIDDCCQDGSLWAQALFGGPGKHETTGVLSPAIPLREPLLYLLCDGGPPRARIATPARAF